MLTNETLISTYNSMKEIGALCEKEGLHAIAEINLNGVIVLIYDERKDGSPTIFSSRVYYGSNYIDSNIEKMFADAKMKVQNYHKEERKQELENLRARIAELEAEKLND